METSLKSYQIQGVEHLQLSDSRVPGVCQVTMFGVGGQRKHSCLVGWSLPYGMKDLHIPNVVDEQRFFKTDD